MLHIGIIPFLHLRPFYQALHAAPESAQWTFHEGTPATLNRMLRAGEIDVAPVSSIEYARDAEHYRILPGLSVSGSVQAPGCVGSVMLFSRRELHELDRCKVLVSTASETSHALFEILCREYLRIEPEIGRWDPLTEMPPPPPAEAVLLIGDRALRNNPRYSTAPNLDPAYRYRYDLGELWWGYHARPFVFALWVARLGDAARTAELRRVCTILDAARERLDDWQREVIAEVRQEDEAAWLKREGLREYWQTLDFGLEAGHLESLQTFYRLAADAGYLERAPEPTLLERG